MNRKRFLKSSVISITGLMGTHQVSAVKTTREQESTYDQLIDEVGFNHLPNQEITTMKSVLHKAETRGNANHGWLKSKHSFSFANYRNPERMNFGVLRVLNDDEVDGGRGFSTHPHDNMEIISIPLEGDLEHKDSMGNTTVIKAGDVQVMSAGTGVYHSEYNKSKDHVVKFLQIWMFPNKKNVEPRYDQITIEANSKEKLQQILSPDKEDDGVWAHQNAWFNMANMESGDKVTYDIKASENGIYFFVLSGKVKVNGQELSKRDGYGVWDTESLSIISDAKSQILIMDVPMRLN